MYIIPATTADIPAINLLVNTAYRGEAAKKGWTTEADLVEGPRTDEKSLADMLHTPGATILIARNEKEELIGCVYLQKQENTYYLGMLTVSPLLQTAGIGNRLLQAAETFVTAAGYHRITMRVISVRHELIAWYERRGYTPTGEIQPFPANPALGMPKQPIEFAVMEKNI